MIISNELAEESYLYSDSLSSKISRVLKDDDLLGMSCHKLLTPWNLRHVRRFAMRVKTSRHHQPANTAAPNPLLHDGYISTNFNQYSLNHSAKPASGPTS